MAYQRAENTDPFFMQDEAPAVFNVEIDGEPLNPFSESSDSNGRNYQPLSNSADTATLPMYNPGTDGLRQAAPQTAPQQQRQPWKIVSLTQSVFGGSTSSANQPEVQKSHAMADGGANYTVSQSFNAQDLNSRQKDRELEAWEAKVLREKEEALKQRESDLLERENALKAQQERSLNSQKKNFPPLCPVMRHHIKEDIPEDLRPLMRSILMLWLLSILAIFYNIFVCLIIMTNKSLNGNETSKYTTAHPFRNLPLVKCSAGKPACNQPFTNCRSPILFKQLISACRSIIFLRWVSLPSCYGTCQGTTPSRKTTAFTTCSS